MTPMATPSCWAAPNSLHSSLVKVGLSGLGLWQAKGCVPLTDKTDNCGHSGCWLNVLPQGKLGWVVLIHLKRSLIPSDCQVSLKLSHLDIPTFKKH